MSESACRSLQSASEEAGFTPFIGTIHLSMILVSPATVWDGLERRLKLACLPNAAFRAALASDEGGPHEPRVCNFGCRTAASL